MAVDLLSCRKIYSLSFQNRARVGIIAALMSVRVFFHISSIKAKINILLTKSYIASTELNSMYVSRQYFLVKTSSNLWF